MEKTIKFKGNKLIISTHIKDFEFSWCGQFKHSNNILYLNDDNLINRDLRDQEGVYCFVQNIENENIIIYVGKTDKDLLSRINQYITPRVSQKTNQRINSELKRLLKEKNSKINIYFLNCNEEIKCVTKDEKGHPSTARIIEMIVTGYCWNKNLLNK